MSSPSKPYVVVAGVDYSETGELALAHGFEITAASERAELHVVHVVASYVALTGFENYSPEALPVAPEQSEAAKALESYVDEKLREFALRRESSALLPARVVSHISMDSPSEQIAALASELEAHLVIVGTHGRRGVSRAILGSVAEGVVRLAPCPVLVVRPRRPSDVPRIEPPCEHCVRTRIATGGRRLWCKQHMERHGPRHVYHQRDRTASGGNLPLVFHG